MYKTQTYLLKSTMSGFQTLSGETRITLIEPNSAGFQRSW